MDLNRIIQDLKAEREVLGGGRGTTGERGEEAGYDYGIGCGTTCRLRKAMGSDRYLPFLPIILNWIQQTLDAHAHERRAVSSFQVPPFATLFFGRTLEYRQRRPLRPSASTSHFCARATGVCRFRRINRSAESRNQPEMWRSRNDSHSLCTYC